MCCTIITSIFLVHKKQQPECVLDETCVGCQDRAELPLLAAHQGKEEELVWVSATCVLKEEMHVINWAEAQSEDPVIWKTIKWMRSKKERSLKYYLGDDASTPEGMGFTSRQKFLVLINGKLYLNCKLKGEAKTTTVFIIPKAHRQKAIDGCHWDADHQGQNQTASLLLDQFCGQE